jgi:hypothetical protein
VRRREIAQVAVTASPELTEIVQFGIPDIIVSAGPAPRAAIELTSHKPTYNNLFQRFPKLYRPSERGIPSYIFQLHDPATMVLGKANLVAAAARAEMLNGTPCVVYLYEDHEVDSVHKLISDLIFAHLRNDKRWLREFHAAARSRNEPLIARYDEKSFGGKTFEVHRDHVVANMRVVRNCDSFPEIECGVNHCESAAAQRVTASEIRRGTHLSALNAGAPVKCMWITKGTGGLDPYPGYLLAGKLLLCTDETGRRTKHLVARFEKIPKDFWWWDAARNRLNNRMIEDIADSVRYQGQAI